MKVMDNTNLVTLISLVQLTDVNVNVNGSGSIPLVLVFVSYEPVNWMLQIPSGVVIDTVMLVSQ